MSSIRVAVPLYRGKRKFHLEKGRRWSTLEHLVLAAVAERQWTVAELAELGDLHHRLVLEILIRLMRAGWVEIRATPGELAFAASAAGIVNAAKSDLPAAARPVSRWMNFTVDRLTGTVFRPREIPPLHINAVRARAEHEEIAWVEPRTFEPQFEVQDLVDRLFREDEQFIAMDPSGDRLMERYGLVLVRGDRIEGLPDRAPDALVEAVRQAARTKPGPPAPGRPRPAVESQGRVEAKEPPVRQVAFASEDLLIGGEANEQAILQLIGRANSRIIIQSTFISEPAMERLRTPLLEAARRGARVDLLWGESDDRRSTGRTRATVDKLRASLAAGGEDELIRLHASSTRSHAKFVIADRSGGAPVALLGSCNWLSSDMKLLEVSARLRDPRLVSDLLYQAAELSRGQDGYFSDLTSEFASYAAEVARLTWKAGPVAARLILAPSHKPLVVEAARDAQNLVFVASHRIAAAARQAVLVPLQSALAERRLRIRLRYGWKPQPPEPDWNSIVAGLDSPNVEVVHPDKPAVHAKLLGWDTDNLVVTSQNWLSADPSEANPRREIGIHLRGAGVALPVAAALFGDGPESPAPPA